MKKLVLMVVAMFALALPAANAQKVNEESELAKLEKANLAINNPKKGAKASTWVAHANAYAEAYAAPTKELGRGVPAQVLMMNVGRPNEVVEGEFLGMPAAVCHYEWVKVYIVNDLIEGWEQLKSLGDNLPQIAIASYKKAYAMDPKQEAKIAAGATNLANSLTEQAEALYNISKNIESAQAFELAYRAQTIVPSVVADPNNLFNAGMQYTMFASTLKGEEAWALFEKGENLFNEALSAGFNDMDGNIYYYLFHCYYGQKDKNRDEYLAKAKEALLTGIKLFPKNATILDGLMQFYTAEEGVGDPAELTEMIEKSLADDPTNYDLWFGRGRVYNAMKQYDECIKSFEKCAELRPNEFEPVFYTAYFIIEKANAEIEKLNSTHNLSYDAYEKENARINLIYAEAMPWLEKAHELNPTDVATIEYLNGITFRLRDMEGMSEKYNKYHELYMQMR